MLGPFGLWCNDGAAWASMCFSWFALGLCYKYFLLLPVLGIHSSHLSLLLLLLHMAPKRGRGVAGRGRGRRGRGGRMPRSSRGGRHCATLVPSSSSSMEEGFWRHDFLLRVFNRNAARIHLPLSFASISSELNLRRFWFRLHGCARSSSWVELETDSSSLIFLGPGWRAFSRQLNLRGGDSLCCHFDGEDTVIIRAFDAGGNRLDPYYGETSSDDSDDSSGGSPASPVSSSSVDPSGDGI